MEELIREEQAKAIMFITLVLVLLVAIPRLEEQDQSLIRRLVRPEIAVLLIRPRREVNPIIVLRPVLITHQVVSLTVRHPGHIMHLQEQLTLHQVIVHRQEVTVHRLVVVAEAEERELLREGQDNFVISQYAFKLINPAKRHNFAGFSFKLQDQIFTKFYKQP
jgi:hypothetical protein